MKVAIFKYKISNSGWKEKGGGECFNCILAEEEMNDFMEDISSLNYEVVEVKTNTYVVDRHNNGGADEVWIAYTILYKD